MGKIITVDKQLNFLDVVANVLKEMYLPDDPLDIARATVILPNNRSARMLHKIFVNNVQRNVEVMPRILPIFGYSQIDRVAMTGKIIEIAKNCNFHFKNFLQSFFFAEELIDLLVEISMADCKIEEIKESLFSCHDTYFDNIATVLECCLSDNNVLKILEKSKNYIELLIAEIKNSKNIFCAGGFTLGPKIVMHLMDVICNHDRGCILLYGDIDGTDENSYKSDLRKFVKYCGYSAANVKKFECEIKATDKNVHMIVANSLREEARIIALIFKKSIWEKKSVTLVTNNQDLASFVKTELLVDNIFPDISFGTPLILTNSGIIAAMAIKMYRENFSTSSVLIFFRKIFSSFKHNFDASIIDEFELFIKKHTKYVPIKFSHAYNIFVSHVGIIKDINLAKFLDKFLNFQAKNETISNDIKDDFKFFFKIHKSILDICAEFLSDYVDCLKDLEILANELPSITLDQYVNFIFYILKKKVSRHHDGFTPGVYILGLLESQLIRTEIMIIGGCNDDSLPGSISAIDSLLNKEIKEKLGIYFDEVRQRQMCCIFEQILNCKEVYLTRSNKISGEEKIPSRLLVGCENFKFDNNEYYKNIIALLDSCYTKNYINYEVRVREHRINRLSVTDIGDLIRNPYLFFTKKILCLKKLKELNDFSNAYGNLIHKIFEIFISEYFYFIKVRSLKECVEKLWEIYNAVMKNYGISKADLGLRYFCIDDVFIFFVKNLMTLDTKQILTEQRGEIEIILNNGNKIVVNCIADRIDIFDDKFISIVDYKSGTVPSYKEIMSGYFPQLPIEGVIASLGGFVNQKFNVGSLCFWKLKSGSQDSGIFVVKNSDSVVDMAKMNLSNVLDQYFVDFDVYHCNNCFFDAEYEHFSRIVEIKYAYRN